MKQDLKVLFVPTTNSGTAYYRMWTWNQAAFRNRAFYSHCPFFKYEKNETNEWEVDINSDMYRARILGEFNEAIKIADVVVMQMVHTQAALEMLYAIKEAYPNLPVVTEMDDDILHTPEYNQAAPFYRPGEIHRNLAKQQLSISDAVVVSTPELKELYSDYNQNIHIIENSMDFNLWNKVKNRKKKGEIRIGWIGGGGHDEDLRIIEPVVHNILSRHREVRFVFVNGVPEFLKNIPGVEVDLGYEFINKYHHFFGSFGIDIGLAPLTDNSFTRGKSNLRWLEYSALKIPCVASSVGHYKQTLNDGDDVLFAKDSKEFEDKLDILITDRAYRNALGHKAYVRAVKDFNVDVNIFKYKEILGSIVEKGPVVDLSPKEYEHVPQAPQFDSQSEEAHA